MQDNSCLLIVPYFISGKGSILNSFSYSMPPVGLLSISGYLRENGIKTNILDLTIQSKLKHSNLESFLIKKIKDFNFPQWVGISVCTPVAYNAYKIAEIIKSNFPEIKIVLGGPHITVLGRRIFDECPNADFLITGEGEYTLCELIKNNDLCPDNLIEKNPVPNIIKIPAKEIEISKLPMPAYDLLEFEKYVPPPASLNSKRPAIGIITSRGCPYKCAFCARITGHKLRFKTIDQIIDEIKYLKEKFQIKQFHFYDDTITCNKNFIKTLCNRFIDENLNLHWSCFARVDTVDEEILGLMKKAGCFVIMYGAESLDEKILLDVKKGITVEQIQKALILTRKAGIESRISLIIGTPTETRESLEKTGKKLLKLDTDFFQVFIAVPMPGSQFYIEAKNEGRVINENWADYNLSKVLYKHKIFTEKELFAIQRKLYLKFYLRPKIIFNTIKSINSWNAIKNALRGLKGFVKIVSS